MFSVLCFVQKLTYLICDIIYILIFMDSLMILDPFFYICAIPAILLFGMAKGGFGGGISMLSVPLMALAVPPVQAAAILLPILVVMDLFALNSFRGQCSIKNLKIIIPGAAIGILVGTFTFSYLSADMIRIIIGTIAVVFTINYWFKRKITQGSKPDRLKGTIWGAIAGFTSFGVHAGGPPISIYLLPQKMDKILLMGTFAWFFSVVNLLKLIPYTWLGLFDQTNMVTSLVLTPLAPVGVALGYFLLGKVSVNTIYSFCYVFLFLAGVGLLFKGSVGIS
jgi:uncharacterized membrane protein YfcA